MNQAVAPPPLSGTLRITFQSDWHCGTGQGRHGGVDRTIARDHDGLPYVPAKTLRGLWRDACEKAALGLDDGTPGEWTTLVHRIFGAPTGEAKDPDTAAGLIDLRPARLPKAWRAGLTASTTAPTRDEPVAALLRRALVVERYGVAIDEETGVANDDTLRLVERARAGLTVETPFRVPVPSDAWAVDLLLQAGAALWHHVGASRRRGAGRCSVTLDGRPALARLVADHRGDVPSFMVASLALTRPAPAAAVLDALQAAPLSRRATITISTLLPVICTRSVQGNVATSHDFIPGATVLPVVAAALGDAAGTLIRHGQLVVTDATPMIGDQRALPAPRTLVAEDKGRAWRLPDGRHGPVFDAFDASAPAGKPVGGWVTRNAKHWRVGTLGLTTSAHANIDDVTQRPTDNGLYTFEAIPAGTRLQCDVLASAAVRDEEWARVVGLNDSEQSLGRYRTGDFGQVRFQVADGAQRVPVTDGPLQEFVLWLTSDAYLVDDLGRPDPTAEQFGKQLSSRLRVDLELKRAAVGVNRRESWTATRALPRPTRSCLAAGSVLGFSSTTSIDPALLAEVLTSGIGEATVEGFGRVRLLREFPGTAAPAEISSAGSAIAPAGRPTEDAWVAFHRLAWEQETRSQIRHLASVPENRRLIAGASPGKAQRGTLREAARALTRDRNAVRRWLVATRSDDDKRNRWGDQTLKAIEDIATQGKDDAAWQARLGTQLNTWGKTKGLIPLPSDLAGLDPAPLAAALIGECLAQQGHQETASGGAL